MDGVFSKFREIADKVTNVVMNYTVVETKVREATNDEPWGPTGAAMQELAHYTYNYEHYSEVMTTVWKRMLFDNKNQWRRVSKTLTLLGYLVRHGSERVVKSARDHMYDMKLLETYQCTDEQGRDQGAIVRQKVRDLLDFIQDDERVRSERKHAKKVKEKMSGISGEAYSSRRHYSDRYEVEEYHNEDPDWQRGGRGDRSDDVYEEDYPRRSQRQSEEYKDDDEDDDDDENARDGRSRTKTKEPTVHYDQRTTKQKTTQNVKDPAKSQKKFGDFQMHRNEEDEFDPRAGEQGDGQDDGYGDFLDYRSKSTQGGSTAAGDLLGLELMTSTPTVSSTYPSSALPPAPLSPKSPEMMGIQPPIIGVQPSMMGVQQNTMGVQPGMMAAQPNLVGGQPNIIGGQPNLMGGQPNLMGGQPNLMGGQPNMMGGQPNIMGGQPNLMGGQPNLMGGQPNMMGSQPNMMGGQPNMMRVQPNMMGGQPRMMGVQPNMISAQPGMMGVQPSMMGVQQQNMMGFYRQPSIMGSQQAGNMGLYSAPGGMHRPIMAGGVSAQGNSNFYHQQSDSLL